MNYFLLFFINIIITVAIDGDELTQLFLLALAPASSQLLEKSQKGNEAHKNKTFPLMKTFVTFLVCEVRRKGKVLRNENEKNEEIRGRS